MLRKVLTFEHISGDNYFTEAKRLSWGCAPKPKGRKFPARERVANRREASQKGRPWCFSGVSQSEPDGWRVGRESGTLLASEALARFGSVSRFVTRTSDALCDARPAQRARDLTITHHRKKRSPLNSEHSFGWSVIENPQQRIAQSHNAAFRYSLKLNRRTK